MKATRIFLLLATMLVVVTCRGRETMASKSARAYEEAMRAGIPVTGEAHGGHAEPHDHAAMSEEPMEPMDHAEMGHSMADHEAMGQRGAGEHVGHAPSAMAQAEHQDHAPAQQSPVHSAMGHAPAMAAPPGAPPRTFPISEAPASSRDMAQLRPSATLSSDPQDAPASSAVEEAQKAAAAATGGHADHQPTPPSHHQNGSRR